MFKRLKNKIFVLEEKVRLLEKENASDRKAVLAITSAVFNLGERIGIYIRCHQCKDIIKTKNGKLPVFNIDYEGFLCEPCIKTRDKYVKNS